MEWLVPILFVLASLAQWWMQRNRQGQGEEPQEVHPPQEKRGSTPPSRREPPPQEEFGDLGDLLEALGRRRHESPPPPAEHTEPPVLPAPPKQGPVPNQIPEPIIVLEKPKPAVAPVLTAFPEAKPAPVGEPGVAFVMEDAPRISFRPFPSAKKAEGSFTHRWAGKLRSPDSVRDAIVLSEILAPPVSLR